MAREVIEKLIDDLDGTDAVETVTFAIDNSSYEIDLNKKNAAALRRALEPYVGAARRATGGSRRRSTPAQPARAKKQARTTKSARAAQRDFDIVQLREWAGANGVDVPSRGRIPQSVVEQYKAAGGR